MATDKVIKKSLQSFSEICKKISVVFTTMELTNDSNEHYRKILFTLLNERNYLLIQYLSWVSFRDIIKSKYVFLSKFSIVIKVDLSINRHHSSIISLY